MKKDPSPALPPQRGRASLPAAGSDGGRTSPKLRSSNSVERTFLNRKNLLILNILINFLSEKRRGDG